MDDLERGDEWASRWSDIWIHVLNDPASVRFEPADAPGPCSDALVGAFREAYGPAQVAWAGFVIIGGPTPDWLLRHELGGTQYDLGPLCRSGTLGWAAPELTQVVDTDRMGNFEALSPGVLADAVAGMLVAGGRMQAQSAHALARSFVDEIVGPQVDDILVLESRSAWSSWFACDVWDRTWLIFNRARDRVWLLCVTRGNLVRRR